ncbi:hypothetical protein HMPREF2626_03145 [Aerococcus sp. HMSC062A02]|nr:hypothetical protein HMPREF2626_03145 [Aerococcus sp. HMSC062A02]OHO44833.1 hypothetical protein HMPREF2705_06410 [Aerococcus sp. HMSC035B07]
MIINTKEIEYLLFDSDFSIYEICVECEIPSRSSLNNARNRKRIDNLTLAKLTKLQNFYNKNVTR